MASREKTESVSSKSSCNIHVIFRFADWIDIVLMVLGTVGAIGDGMSTNVALVFASKIMNSLGYGQNNHHTFKDEVQKVSHLSIHKNSTLCKFEFLGGLVIRDLLTYKFSWALGQPRDKWSVDFVTRSIFFLYLLYENKFLNLTSCIDHEMKNELFNRFYGSNNLVNV